MCSGRDAKAMILTTQLQVLIKGALQPTSRGDRWEVTAKKRERRQTLWANCVAAGLAHGDQAFLSHQVTCSLVLPLLRPVAGTEAFVASSSGLGSRRRGSWEASRSPQLVCQ